MWKTRGLRPRPAGSPEAPFSARSCLRLPRASASLGQSAACAALAGHIGLVFHIESNPVLTEAVGPLAPALVQVQQHARLVGVRVMVRAKRTLAWRGRLKGSRTVGRQADRCGCLGGGSVAWWVGGVGVLSSEARAAARLKVGGGRVHECELAPHRASTCRRAQHTRRALRPALASTVLLRRRRWSRGRENAGRAALVALVEAEEFAHFARVHAVGRPLPPEVANRLGGNVGRRVLECVKCSQVKNALRRVQPPERRRRRTVWASGREPGGLIKSGRASSM